MFVDAAPIGCGVTTAVHAAKMGRVDCHMMSVHLRMVAMESDSV